jgi:RNA polymerase sigma-70 factor (ECF subfamily)
MRVPFPASRGVPRDKPPPASDGDTGLIDRCRRGDEAAWRQLVSKHTRRVFNVVFPFAGRRDEAEDLTQEVFVKVYQVLDRYRPTDASFSTWLNAVARNHAIDHYRRRREERRRTLEDAGVLELLASPVESPQRRLEQNERVALVRRGLRALPAQLREPLVMCDLQGLAYAEIASLLALPLGTVKSRINRGRLELAKRLVGRHRGS